MPTSESGIGEVLELGEPSEGTDDLSQKESQRFFDHSQAMNQQELGLVGRFIGGKHAPTNIAFVVIISSMLLAAIFFGVDVYYEGRDFSSHVSTLISTATLAIGYVFGGGGKSGDR